MQDVHADTQCLRMQLSKIRFFLGPTFVSKRVGRVHLKLKFFFLNFCRAALVPNEYLDTK